MQKKNEKVNLKKLSDYERIVYLVMCMHEYKKEKSTLEKIHFEVVNSVLKNRIEVEPGATIIKALKKLATANKTTGEWQLKPVVEPLFNIRPQASGN